MANALATHSNEGKIQRGLEHLGCAARNFVSIAKTVGLTRFMEGLNGVPGRHFSDAAAQRMLEFLGELYELQIDVDAVNGSHIPIEERSSDEVIYIKNIRIAPDVHAAHPGFDVTPARYITAIITERGIARAPYTESLRALANATHAASV